jgi:pyruvate/2-oxoglutarate dehydrogenase complex dihydrolipoamide acyltransferase (E2) component
MNRMRLRIAERLKQSQNTAASLTTFNEVDISSLMEFRKLYKDEILKKTGVKLGFMSAFSRASILAMRDIPAVNASIEGPAGGDTIVYRDYVDISVAVATEKGLVTPVVRNAESLDLVGIEEAIADLGKKVKKPMLVCHSTDSSRLETASSQSKTWQEGLLRSATFVAWSQLPTRTNSSLGWRVRVSHGNSDHQLASDW